jgi:hypothetical protein
MRRQNGLGALQMGVRWKDRAFIDLASIQEGSL